MDEVSGDGQSLPSSFAGRSVRITAGERVRSTIMSWRLRRSYLAYCITLSSLTTFLLVWSVVRGVQGRWALAEWRHYAWEEWLEVFVGACLLLETVLTLAVVGWRSFLQNVWCLLDAAVVLLAVVSITYGACHLATKTFRADVPLLLLRFALQPFRMLAACAATYRAQRMQHDVNELQIDFSSSLVST